MNILGINKFYYPKRGAERHFLDVIDLLRQDGNTVAVFTMDDTRNVSREYAKYCVSPVGYHRSDATLWQRVKGIGRLFWSFEARRNIEALIHDARPDIVHIHNIYHQLSLSILPVIKQHNIPIVMTVHDYHLISPDKDRYYEFVGTSYWKFLFVKKYSFGKRLLLVCKMYWERQWQFYEQAVDVYIVPSEYVKSVLVRGGIALEKIQVVPHFVSDTFQQITPEISGTYALYFGALSREKGVGKLAELFTRLQYPLVLAGNVEGGLVVKENQWVQAVGHKTSEDLIRLIRGAHFVVSGSVLPETFGLIALEALACGKPFFGLRVGALPELITDGKNGYLASDWEELEKGIRDFLSDKMSIDDNTVIREWAVKNYSKEVYKEKLEAIFASLQSQC